MDKWNITVGELIDVLKEQDPSKIVFISKDEEGNEFKPLPNDVKFLISTEYIQNLDVPQRILDKLDDDENVVVLWPIG